MVPSPAGLMCSCHLTARFTDGLVCPPLVTVSGIATAGVTPAGTTKFTWYRPTNPGTSPAKLTGAFLPPIVAVTPLTSASGDDGLIAPSATAGVVATSPVQ